MKGPSNILGAFASLIGGLINLPVRGIEKGAHHSYHVRTFPWAPVLWLALTLLALLSGSIVLLLLALIAAVVLWITRASPYRPEARIVFGALGVILLALSIAGTLGVLAVVALASGCGYYWQDPLTAWVRLRVSVHRVYHATQGKAVVDARPDERTLTIHMTAHHRLEDIHAEPVARVHNARTAIIVPDEHTAGIARVELFFGPDPLSNLDPIEWPGPTSLWEPVPVGITESGQPVGVNLFGRNLLLGGEQGGGKSNMMQLFLATAATDPDCRLWLMDRKELELWQWEPHAQGFAVTIDQAIDLLGKLGKVMDDRQAELKGLAARKINRSMNLPLHVLFIDELASYTKDPKKAKFNPMLEDVIRRGRALGVILVGAVQHPHSETIPTGLRDLIGYRMGFRCLTSTASDLVLGEGYAAAGFDCSKVRAEDRGVGWLRAEGASPVRMKAFFFTDVQLARMAGETPKGICPDHASMNGTSGQSTGEAERPPRTRAPRRSSRPKPQASTTSVRDSAGPTPEAPA